MNASDIMSELSIRIYEPPLLHLRESGKITDISNPVAVLMLVIDFETEMSMNGVEDFIGNSTGLYASETVKALHTIGCDEAAEKLDMILKRAENAGMTHEAIQKERRLLEPYAVFTFEKVHGDKWNKVIDEIDVLAGQINFQHVFRCAEDFIDRHKQVFVELLKNRKG